jgi:peptidoglycan/LPS O-acetylase OafA/YrhL
MTGPAPTVRLRGDEGLRPIAASLIVLFYRSLYGSPGGRPVNLGGLGHHVFPYLPVGATVFFCLSAFLLYSLFLWHEPLVRWLGERGFTVAGRGGLLANVALVFVLVLALAVLRPVRRVPERRTTAS